MSSALGFAFVGALLLTACGSAASSAPQGAHGSVTGTTGAGSPSPSAPATDSNAPGEPSATPDAAAPGLIAGVRADLLATDCQQIQGDLPIGLSEVVVCLVGSDLVDQVTFTRYTSLAALLDFYETRLDEHGIPLATDVGLPGEGPEDCWRGDPSESLYSPAGVGSETNREGCFLDEDGKATQLYAWQGALVLITVEGSTADIAALKAWSWNDIDGEEPALGGPGLWQPPA